MPTVAAATLELFGSLPQFVQQQIEDGGWNFLTWLDGAAGAPLQVLNDLARDQGDYPGWSVILDVNRTKTEDLPYLAQYVGVRLNGSMTDAAQRAAIVSEQGFQRGTPAAIVLAGNSQLATGYACTLIERTPDPYSLTVDVPAAGLAGGTYGDLTLEYATYALLEAAFATYGAISENSTACVAAILAAVPGGIVTTINFI